MIYIFYRYVQLFSVTVLLSNYIKVTGCMSVCQKGRILATDTVLIYSKTFYLSREGLKLFWGRVHFFIFHLFKTKIQSRGSITPPNLFISTPRYLVWIYLENLFIFHFPIPIFEFFYAGKIVGNQSWKLDQFCQN